MSVSSDSHFDMNDTGEMNDRDVERLLSGRMPAADEAPKLAGFLADLEVAYPEPSIDHCEASHLSAIFAAAQQVADADRTTGGQAGDYPTSGERTRGLGDERRNRMAGRLPKWLGVKLAIPVAVVLFAFGGVGVAGGLAYHQATNAEGPPEVTQPGSGDAALDAGGQDDLDEVEDALIEGTDLDDSDDVDDQAGVHDSDDTAVGEDGEFDAEDSDDVDEPDGSDDADDATFEQDDADDHNVSTSSATDRSDDGEHVDSAPGDEAGSEDRVDD